MKRKCIFLIEWRTRETHWSELGQGVWEADHNGEIWFTKEGANAKMSERLNIKCGHRRKPKLTMGDIYEMRVAEYVPKKSQKSTNNQLYLTGKTNTGK